MNQLVTPSFLFRWSFPVPHLSSLPKRTGRLLDLPESCRLPSVRELDGVRDFADIRVAWNNNGLGIGVTVAGKNKPTHCSAESPFESDGLMVWIDTRNTQGVHRATRYCHQFFLMPLGTGRKKQDPAVVQMALARAREDQTGAEVSGIQLQSEVGSDGYWLDAWLPAAAFTGFDPANFPRLGFHCQVRDLQLGDQSLAVSDEFPVSSDPSLWQTLELVGG